MLESNFEDWPFMTVHFWGERAAGTWKLEVINAGNKRVNQPGKKTNKQTNKHLIVHSTIFELKINVYVQEY